MIFTHLFILASLATVSTASSEKKSPPPPDTRRLAHLTGSSDAQLTRNMGALLTDMAALLTDMDALLTTTVTTDDDDGTAYPVTLVPGATVAALWQALAALDGTLNRTNYDLHGLKHLRLARTRTLAGVLTSLLPGAPGTKVQRLIGRFARSGAPLPDAATVADYLTIVATARQELITAFESDPGSPGHVTISGGSNETAETDGYGSVRLGPLVPRGTPLRARLRLDRLGANADIGLVREEAWANVGTTGIERAGWTYDTYGRLHANCRVQEARELPEMRRAGGEVEVELRWDAETGVGQLLYTIDGAAQDPAFQIPAEGGDVGLAMQVYNGTRMTLVAE